MDSRPYLCVGGVGVPWSGISRGSIEGGRLCWMCHTNSPPAGRTDAYAMGPAAGEGSYNNNFATASGRK